MFNSWASHLLQTLSQPTKTKRSWWFQPHKGGELLQLGDKDYPSGNNHIPSKITFEDDFPFPKVGYVNSLEGMWISPLDTGPFHWLIRIQWCSPPWSASTQIPTWCGAFFVHVIFRRQDWPLFCLFLFVSVWFGLVWFVSVWFGLVWFVSVWFGLVWFGLVGFVSVWFGLVWFVSVWFGLVWFGLFVLFVCFVCWIVGNHFLLKNKHTEKTWEFGFVSKLQKESLCTYLFVCKFVWLSVCQSDYRCFWCFFFQGFWRSDESEGLEQWWHLMRKGSVNMYIYDRR